MIRKLLITLILFSCLLSAAGAENFYESYPATERLMIADAYLAVSENYARLGENDKAESFKAIALAVYPDIEAAREAGKTGSAVVTAPAEPAQIQTAAPARPSGKEASAVRYFFSKLMRAVFAEDLSGVMSLISTRLYLPGYDQGVTKEEVSEYLVYAFEKYPLESTDPSLLYDFNRYFIKKEGSSWTVRLNMTELGSELFFEKTGLPGASHIFYFREYREGWRLIAINAE